VSLKLRTGMLLGTTLAWLCAGIAGPAFGQAPEGSNPASIFSPASTPASSIYSLSLFVLVICGAIFVTVFGLLVYSVVKYRRREGDDGSEPPQIYGSNQVELAWTVIPVLIVVVFFLATARVIHAVEDALMPAGTTEVTAVGHQFWWEYRSPQLGFIAANELHVPVSDPQHPTPTHITLLSADTDHSFWVPRLAGKTDLIPNRTNHMWIDPHETGVYVGQCAQYCGTQHAKMLLRIIVQSRADFDRWVAEQRQPAQEANITPGRQIFETTACVNCHTVAGTNAHGTFGPDLTHLMSRETIGAGAALNNPENLRQWVEDPDHFKPGVLMPAMQLDGPALDAVTEYLLTLK
jgi:cytochrome c oxidase subunit II